MTSWHSSDVMSWHHSDCQFNILENNPCNIEFKTTDKICARSTRDMSFNHKTYSSLVMTSTLVFCYDGENLSLNMCQTQLYSAANFVVRNGQLVCIVFYSVGCSICISTYSMISHSTKRSYEAERVSTHDLCNIHHQTNIIAAHNLCSSC